jgi:Protein of unknown function (DUF2924)
MRVAPKKAVQSRSAEDLAAEISRLMTLSLAELRSAWCSEFTCEAPKALWRDLLLRMLAWRLQEKAFGGHDKATLKLLDGYIRKKEPDPLYGRLKSGTVLIRDFEGARHTVTIVADGFVWQDRTYASLSATAKSITGTNWNGPRFFGLREGRAKRDVGAEARA